MKILSFRVLHLPYEIKIIGLGDDNKMYSWEFEKWVLIP